MRCCRIDKAIQVVKDTWLDLGRFFLLIYYLKIFVQDHNRGLCDNDCVAELRRPIYCLHFGYGHFVQNFTGAQVIHKQAILGEDQDFTERTRENFIDLSQVFLYNRPFLCIAAVKTGYNNFPVRVQAANLVLACEEGRQCFPSSLLNAACLRKVLIKLHQQVLATLLIKC